MSSHAALVARQLGKVCVCGATNIVINYEKKTLTADGVVLKEGDYISLDGSTGEIYAGPIDSADSEVKRVLSGSLKASQSYTYRLFETVMEWADKYRRLRIRTNADTPGDGAASRHVWRGRHRSVPHGTHVFRRRSHRRHAAR